MSGIEIVGLVFAVLPLFIEASDQYSHLYRSLSQNKYNRARKEFWDSFNWEVYELRKTLTIDLLETVSDTFPIRSRLEGGNRASLTRSSTIRAIVHMLFPSEADKEPLKRVLERVALLFSELIDDATLASSAGMIVEEPISEAKQDWTSIYRKLESLRVVSAKDPSLRDRFKFFNKQEKREKCLKDLQVWNIRLRRIILDAQQQARQSRVFVETVRNAPARHAISRNRYPMSDSEVEPATNLRTLSRNLFVTLSQYWAQNCECPSQTHGAKVSLDSCCKDAREKLKYGTEASYDLVISKPISVPQGRDWHECTATIRTVLNFSDPKTPLNGVCSALKSCINAPNRQLELWVECEQTGQRQSVWPNLRYARNTPPNETSLGSDEEQSISFDDIICPSSPRWIRKPSLMARRKLALLFAYSLFQLYESPWLSNQWDREHIHFFKRAGSTCEVDLSRPFLNVSFDGLLSCKEDYENVLHGNLGILKLGILLVELEKWKPIELLRKPKDFVDGEPAVNVDMFTAGRVAGEKMNSCHEFYRNAVVACLDVPWARAGRGRISLDDDSVREGIFRDVIVPLEKEIEWGANFGAF
ncbi:hypothetical protein BJ508DRAFT_411646 [Ascobolus immersus RN42]|uniref:DUF7580 domain-containing protein n=1 Tax=Ascobolus immersus RN42 TaxID=1160509 RepID=A0A3N4IWT0_ASCIM|nr:hypothetical protein BJ508DRAFT_411646 [Ascobolus immersus RN42]